MVPGTFFLSVTGPKGMLNNKGCRPLFQTLMSMLFLHKIIKFIDFFIKIIAIVLSII